MAGDGGLPLLSYELQMGRPGTLNDFVEVTGGDPYTLQNYFIVTRDIIMGQDYAFRYRAINAVGPGEWSDTVILKAATVPSPPGKPYYIGSTATTVTLGLPETTDNGGAKIRSYQLFRDSGDLSSDITTEVTAYDGTSQEFIVEGLTAGVVYRFAYYAVNDFGTSDPSLILTIASTELPEPPTDIVIDWA